MDQEPYSYSLWSNAKAPTGKSVRNVNSRSRVDDRADVPEADRRLVLSGATEINLVRSGLEDTMRVAYEAISAAWNDKENIPDLRTAAMMIAVDRVAKSYVSIGL